jgi:hypothetical protein
VRIFDRSGGPPADVLTRARLPRGEKVLASAVAADGTWVLGTRRSLAVVPVGSEARLVPWEQVEDAAWEQDGTRLRLTEIGQYGEPRPSYDLVMDSHPALLLQLVRERVTASVVLQRWVPVRGRSGLTVIGRRSPAGGPVVWMHAYDRGLDPADPEVVVVADLALLQARAEVGDEAADEAPHPI